MCEILMIFFCAALVVLCVNMVHDLKIECVLIFEKCLDLYYLLPCH